MEKKTSKAMLILGYEPDPKLIFEPVGKCVDNEDGSCVIEVEIDGMYTKKIQELLPDISQEVKSMICDNVDLEAEAILDKVAIRGEHINKTKREIIMEYQREKIAEPEFEYTPFVDQTAEALQTTKEDLQTTATNLQTTQTDLQTTATNLQTTRTELADLKERLNTHTHPLEPHTHPLEPHTHPEIAIEKAKTHELQQRLTLIEHSHAALVARLEALENI